MLSVILDFLGFLLYIVLKLLFGSLLIYFVAWSIKRVCNSYWH